VSAAWKADNGKTNYRLQDLDAVMLVADDDVPAGTQGVVVHARTVRVFRPGCFANVDVLRSGLLHRIRVPHNALRILRDHEVRSEFYAVRAAQSARIRCHDLAPFEEVGPGVLRAACATCGREVWARYKPAPNDTYVTGEAVALNCSTNFEEGATL
jgi:hypothetical protein